MGDRSSIGMGHLRDAHTMRRAGKAAAGRLLDGRIWDQLPGEAGAAQ